MGSNQSALAPLQGSSLCWAQNVVSLRPVLYPPEQSFLKLFLRREGPEWRILNESFVLRVMVKWQKTNLLPGEVFLRSLFWRDHYGYSRQFAGCGLSRMFLWVPLSGSRFVRATVPHAVVSVRDELHQLALLRYISSKSRPSHKSHYRMLFIKDPDRKGWMDWSKHVSLSRRAAQGACQGDGTIILLKMKYPNMFKPKLHC